MNHDSDGVASTSGVGPGMQMPAAPKASLGRVVIVVGTLATSNNVDHAPGMVNRVWANDMVNLIVFPDNAVPRPATSVKIYPDEAAAREAVARIRTQTGSDAAGVAAYWPPRV